MFEGVLGSGISFRRALQREPLDIQQRMLLIRKKLEEGSISQAYNLLNNTEANSALKARLYERIGRTAKAELAKISRQKAIEQYLAAGQKDRAEYLSHLM